MKARLPRSARRALMVIANDVEPDEQVLQMVVGLLHTPLVQQSGLLVLTDRRILFIHSGMIQSQQVSVPLDTVTGIAVSKGLMYSNLKTTGAQSNVVVNRVDKTDAESFAAQLRSILANRASGSTDSSRKSTGHVSEEIERLASLRDRGILTELEFSVQKTKLLAQDNGP